MLKDVLQKLPTLAVVVFPATLETPTYDAYTKVGDFYGDRIGSQQCAYWN